VSAPKYPPSTSGLPRLQQSGLETYLRCGIRWALERETKHRHATVPMLVGSGVAGAAREDGRAKIVTGAGLTVGECVDVAVVEYETELETAEVPEPAAEVARGKDRVADAARCFAGESSPRIKQLVAVESPIVALVEGQFELAGTPDVIDADGVGELKTGQPWTQERVDRSRQLTLYGLLRQARHGEFPRRVWVESLSETRRGWSAERLWSSRAPEDYAALIYTVQRAAQAMAAGVTLPAPEGAWWCSAKWCPFWGRGCPAVPHDRR